MCKEESFEGVSETRDMYLREVAMGRRWWALLGCAGLLFFLPSTQGFSIQKVLKKSETTYHHKRTHSYAEKRAGMKHGNQGSCKEYVYYMFMYVENFFSFWFLLIADWFYRRISLKCF